MATPTLPTLAPGTAVVLHPDLALRVVAAAGETTVTAVDGAGAELGRLATVATSSHPDAAATTVAAALAIAATTALRLWPAAS